MFAPTDVEIMCSGMIAMTGEDQFDRRRMHDSPDAIPILGQGYFRTGVANRALMDHGKVRGHPRTVHRGLH